MDGIRNTESDRASFWKKNSKTVPGRYCQDNILTRSIAKNMPYFVDLLLRKMSEAALKPKLQEQRHIKTFKLPLAMRGTWTMTNSA